MSCVRLTGLGPRVLVSVLCSCAESWVCLPFSRRTAPACFPPFVIFHLSIDTQWRFCRSLLLVGSTPWLVPALGGCD